jgi:hypothetical protein
MLALSGTAQPQMEQNLGIAHTRIGGTSRGDEKSSDAGAGLAEGKFDRAATA